MNEENYIDKYGGNTILLEKFKGMNLPIDFSEEQKISQDSL